MSEYEHHHEHHEHGEHHGHHQKGFKGFVHRLKKISWQKWIVIGAAFAVSLFILINSCLPGNASNSVSTPVVEAAANVINTISPGTIQVEPEIPADFSNFVRKFIGHFSLFGVLGILATLSSYFFVETYSSKNLSISFLFSFLYGLGLSIITEVIQTFVTGRSGEFTDAMIDLGGFTVGLLIIFIIQLIRYIIKHRRIYG